MRINAHAHIFNLQIVLTREAIEIIARRVGDRGLPDYVVGAVRRIVDRQLDHPEYLVEEELLERFLNEIAADSKQGRRGTSPATGAGCRRRYDRCAPRRVERLS